MTMISEAGDEVLSRGLWKLRRWWWLPTALGVALGTAVFVLREPAFQATVTFYPVPNSPTLEAAELDAGLLAELAPIDADAAALRGASVRRAVTEAAGGEQVTISLSTAPAARSVTVTISGATAKAVEAARTTVAKSFTDLRTARVAAAVETAVSSLTASRTALQDQVDSLAERIEASPGVSGAVLIEMTELSETLASTNSKLEALRQVVTKPDEIVQLAGQGDVERAGGRLISALAAVLLGVVVGLGAIYVSAYRDRTVRSRKDVRPDVDVLAVIPSPDQEASAKRRLAAVLSSSGGVTGSPTLDLVPSDTRTNPEMLEAALASDALLSSVVKVRSQLPLDVDGEAARAEGPCVVVAAFGVTTRDDLDGTLDDLRRIGRQVVGVVLVDVPVPALRLATRRR